MPKHAPIEGFGRLREERLAAGLSQEEAAELLEVTQPAVSYWESGECVPHPAVQRWILETIREHSEEGSDER